MAARAPAFWLQRKGLARLLFPLSLLFGALAALRRVLFSAGWLATVRLPVPVIVVGNIAVGGSGKTPTVEWLVSMLRSAGWSPGIVSRGYGGTVDGVALVMAVSDPAQFGDEPVLLARLTGCPVAVGRDRPAAARALLAAHPECDLIVADDGMQHYRLARDIEIAVVDQATLGNGWLLPAGPLREPLSRLARVDLVIAHGPLSASSRRAAGAVPVVGMALSGGTLRRLRNPAESLPVSAFSGQRIHALAGIGRPERFFDQLRAMGLDVVEHPFPDHHRYTAADLDFAPGEAKLMTSKDAVKCASFAPDNAWEFPVQATIGSGAADRILEKLNNGRQTA
ncbi:MAG: tetraacyldisaccharide 4'-kinase [Azoarcus sp.]|nr:tetraacyldisaccharide 4'-kinase [Azoarcus sp.]